MNVQKSPSKKVYNSFSVRVAEASPCGCRVRETYILRLNDRHFKEPYKTGEFDQYEYIQSFRADCDMKVLISRYLNGDPALADRPWPTSAFEGVTDLRSILDAQNRLKTAYETLSDADKANYALNDIIDFLGNPDGLKAFVEARRAKAASSEASKTPESEVTQ